MYIIKNSNKSKNVVFFDVDGFERAIRFAIQTGVAGQNHKNILNDYTINYSNAMKHYAQKMLNELRNEGEEFEIVDLSQYKGEEYKIKFSVFNDVYGTVRATTKPIPGQEGKFAVGLAWEGTSKINTNEKE